VKFVFGVILLFCGGLLFGQRSTYNDCSGAVFAPVEGKFSLSFLGDKKSNQIWVVFVAPKSGEVELAINAISSSLIVTKGVIIRSNAEICDLTERKNQTIDSISFELRGSKNLNFHVEKNEFASLCLTTAGGVKDDVLFSCKFKPGNSQEEEHVLNLVYDKTLPTYTLLIRDEQTLTPIAGRIFLQGSAEVSGSYYASKLYMNLKQPIKKGAIKIDAPGYFPVEFKERSIPHNGQATDTILLHKFEEGELTTLEQVYFSAGLPEIMEESYAQLNRLRDLLILNPGISIEIHGHVNLDENSSKKAQKLSKQRAMMVKKYLIQNGVDPERLYPIGFGSSKPVYAKPQDEEQKEANRRVEILIRKN
jgi:outer membrane protein OmpA-like peptidoglycan-associated protein